MVDEPWGPPDIDYHPSVVHFRLAIAFERRAHIRHAQYEATDDFERRNREVDACIGTIMLTQAALECWINEVHADEHCPALGTWIQRWSQGSPRIAERLGRPVTVPSRTLVSRLQQLSAWRQFLVHGDASARSKFSTEMGVAPADAPQLLNAELASWCIALADDAFAYGADATGHLMPASNTGHWIAPDEL